jgi:LysM repeat protein
MSIPFSSIVTCYPIVFHNFTTSFACTKIRLEEIKMLKRKQKIKLSDNLKFGIQGPSSQGLLFKTAGAIFFILSLFLAVNIIKSFKVSDTSANTITQSSPTSQVLGAYDDKRQQEAAPKTAELKEVNYTIQKGDTLFNIAQQKNVNWVVIATMNDLKAPYNLKPGSVIKLPTLPAIQ